MSTETREPAIDAEQAAAIANRHGLPAEQGRELLTGRSAAEAEAYAAAAAAIRAQHTPSPVNRPRVRTEIAELERKLSATSSSAEREPILDQLERKQAELRAFYRHRNGEPPEPPRENLDPESEPT